MTDRPLTLGQQALAAMWLADERRGVDPRSVERAPVIATTPVVPPPPFIIEPPPWDPRYVEPAPAAAPVEPPASDAPTEWSGEQVKAA